MAAEHSSFDAHVLTPEGELYSGEVTQVSTRTQVGEIGILAHHAPVVARLWPGLLRLHTPDGEVRRYAQGEGWLEVFANRARVLIVEAVAPEDLDAGELKERLSDAEQRLKDTEEGTAANLQAWRDHRRAESFIQIAEDT